MMGIYIIIIERIENSNDYEIYQLKDWLYRLHAKVC